MGDSAANRNTLSPKLGHFLSNAKLHIHKFLIYKLQREHMTYFCVPWSWLLGWWGLVLFGSTCICSLRKSQINKKMTIMYIVLSCDLKSLMQWSTDSDHLWLLFLDVVLVSYWGLNTCWFTLWDALRAMHGGQWIFRFTSQTILTSVKVQHHSIRRIAYINGWYADEETYQSDSSKSTTNQFTLLPGIT